MRRTIFLPLASEEPNAGVSPRRAPSGVQDAVTLDPIKRGYGAYRFIALELNSGALPIWTWDVSFLHIRLCVRSIRGRAVRWPTKGHRRRVQVPEGSRHGQLRIHGG